MAAVAGTDGDEGGGGFSRWGEMARNASDKATSIDAQLRLLAPKKLSEDDKLVEYDALLIERFLGILQGLQGDKIRETVVPPPSIHPCYPALSFQLPVD